METIDEMAIINQAPLPNQGIAGHESFTPSTDDCRRDTQEAFLVKANLSRANLSWANLSRALLHDADLSGAYLGGANLNQALLFNANLSSASLFDTNLNGARLGGANLRDARFIHPDLRGAFLSEVRGFTWEQISDVMAIIDDKTELPAEMENQHKDELRAMREKTKKEREDKNNAQN